MSRKLLGFQLANGKGVNISGDDDDPTSMASFEVMRPELAIETIAKLDGARFLLMPIFEGDIQEPTII